MTGTDLELASCALAVHDVDEALGFYRDALGFEVRDEAGPPGTRRVGVRSPAQPTTHIILEAPTGDPVVSSANRQALWGLMALGLLSRLVFSTTDCDATFERIESAGAEVMQEPIARADGVRDCVFLDPSGNMLRFTQPLHPTPSARSTGKLIRLPRPCG
ncbi:VOC family protein [Streptomyces sp. NPDC058257]|uniref:VOC family protein n=1 Tax=Streptomyces sp. NPDC058257 TaxID=3346409 RepID=UPI0036EE5F2B